VNSLPLLYFDSRMSEEMMASDEVVDARLTKCLSGKPLRLIFSGRLLKIKGADGHAMTAVKGFRAGDHGLFSFHID
jgi:colanic acid/amylovoran biosynthesis glycosyltransferase